MSNRPEIEEPVCRLVNPLCPDDLCMMGLNHPGSTEGIHHLSTMAGPCEVSEVMYLSHSAHTKHDLIQEGAQAAQKLWPGMNYCG